MKKNFMSPNGKPQSPLRVTDLTSYRLNVLTTSKKVAFTLAEVLITLGVIGVVAAMTIPTLVGQYKKIQTVSQLTKAYAELNQVLKLAEVDNGTMDSWDFSNNTENTDEIHKYFAENYIYPYIKVIKKCPGENRKDCWAEEVKSIDGTKSSRASSGHDKGAFVTSSGYSVRYWLHAIGNGGWLWVDLNGKKEPNTIGADVFPFIMSWGSSKSIPVNSSECLRKYGVFPMGLSCIERPTREDLINGTAKEVSGKSNCIKGENKDLSGGYCGALIMYDGWKIKDDYPYKF